MGAMLNTTFDISEPRAVAKVLVIIAQISRASRLSEKPFEGVQNVIIGADTVLKRHFLTFLTA